jgi:hypothetical protein
MGGGKRKAHGQRLTVTRVFTIAQLINYSHSKLMGPLGVAGSMQNDAHLGAAEFHQLAAPARRDAAADHVRKKSPDRARASPADNGAGHKALERLQEAYRKSV